MGKMDKQGRGREGGGAEGRDGIRLGLSACNERLFFLLFRSGKTTFINRLLRYQNYMLNKPAQKIVYFYTEISAQIKRISKIPLVEIVQNFNQDIIDDWSIDKGHLIVVVDDHMLENGVYGPLAELFSVKSRKKFISCALLTQNLYTKGVANAARFSKEILGNSTVTILFCNKRDQSLIRTFARSAFSGRFQFFLSAYRMAVCAEGKSSGSRNNGHKYLAIFSDAHTSNKFELRTRIFFKNEVPELFWQRKWKF